MVAVYFVYGLAFFLLGFAVLLYPKRGTAFALGRTIPWIGAFGILHGANEWLDMFSLVYDPDGVTALPHVRSVVLAVSYVPLLVFGLSRKTIRGRLAGLRWPIPVLLLMLVGAVLLTGPERPASAGIWGRYLMGATGAALAAWRLNAVLSEPHGVAFAPARVALRAAVATFVAYGFLAGIMVPRAQFFPATILNEAVFLQVIGVPVQLFRMACAVILLACFVLILRTFAIETQEALRRANEDLEVRVKERTVELETALSEVRTLRGLLPVCAWCGKIRNDKDLWMETAEYIREHTDALVTHSICPGCRRKIV